MKLISSLLTVPLLFFTFLHIITELIFAQPIKTSIPMNLTKTDDGKAITLHVGQTFQLTLPENPSTGFAWVIAPNQAKIIKVSDSQYQAQEPVMPGSPGQRIFSFMAIKAGKTQLKIHYQHPWESVDNAVEHYCLTIEVKAK